MHPPGVLEALVVFVRERAGNQDETGSAAPPEDTAGPPLQTPLETIKAWSQYSRERFDAESARLVEFRNWARQLTAAIGVVIAIEVNAAVQVIINGDSVGWAVRVSALLLLLLAMRWQVQAFGRALRTGYRGDPLTGPESPAKLSDFILGKNEWETHRLIGACYAKSYASFYQLAENLGVEIASASNGFRRSLWPLTFAIIVMVIGLFLHRESAIWTAHEWICANSPRWVSESANCPRSEPTRRTISADEPAPPNSHSWRTDHERGTGRSVTGKFMNERRVKTPSGADTDAGPGPEPAQDTPSWGSTTFPDGGEVGRLLDTPTAGEPVTKSEEP